MRFIHTGFASLLALTASLPAQAQSAPPLTSVRIIQVSSVPVGLETITSGQTTTVKDHTDNTGRVVIREIGIGTNRIIRMAGQLISPDYQLSSRNLCGTASNPSTSCSAGQQIIGQDITYRFDGYPNGLFDYRVRSVNGSQVYLTTSINIR